MGTGEASVIFAVATAFVAWHISPRATLVLAFALALMLQAGILQTSVVPGVAQLAYAAASAKRWTDRQTKRASCSYREYNALTTGGVALLERVEAECRRYQ